MTYIPDVLRQEVAEHAKFCCEFCLLHERNSTYDGTDSTGLYADGQWLLLNDLTGSNATTGVAFGPAESGWQPLVGDWNADSLETPGLYKEGTWRLRNTISDGSPDAGFNYGAIGWTSLSGFGGNLNALNIYSSGTMIVIPETVPPEAPADIMPEVVILEVTPEPEQEDHLQGPRVTICHVTGDVDDSANWVILTLPAQALGDYFNADDTPRANFEQDFIIDSEHPAESCAPPETAEVVEPLVVEERVAPPLTSTPAPETTPEAESSTEMEVETEQT